MWWTLRHDVDLIQGTYKYGYATYNLMRQDPNLSFHGTELVSGQYSEFPNADNITRRLKKLVQIFGKNEYHNNLSFEQNMSEKEPTNLSLQEKQAILEVLTDKGLVLTKDGKDDYGWVKNELLKKLEGEKKEESPIEKKQTSEVKTKAKKTDDEFKNPDLTKIELNQPEEQKDDQNLQAEKNLIANTERFVIRLRMFAH